MTDRRVYGDVDAPVATVHTVRLQNGSYVDVAFRWNNTLEPPPILTPVIIACVVVAITPLVAVAVCACLRRRRTSPGASTGSQKSGLAHGSEADAAKQRLLQCTSSNSGCGATGRAEVAHHIAVPAVRQLRALCFRNRCIIASDRSSRCASLRAEVAHHVAIPTADHL